MQAVEGARRSWAGSARMEQIGLVDTKAVDSRRCMSVGQIPVFVEAAATVEM